MLKISIVIPNWNGRKQLEENLPHIISQNPHEIIIIDDCSHDDSIKYVKSKFKGVKIIENKKKLHFAQSCNEGVTTATGNLVCLLNADVKPQNSFLSNSQKYFSDPNLFGISLHEKGFGPSLSEFKDGFIGFKKGNESQTPQSTFWISGGSSIIRRSLWKKLGGFDSKLFPFYFEDLDLSYRAAKRGYKLLWAHDCPVEHKHETYYNSLFTSETLDFMKQTRLLLFIWKNLTDKILFAQHLKALPERVLTAPGYIKIILSALSKIGAVISRRKEEKIKSVITDTEILEKSAGKEK